LDARDDRSRGGRPGHVPRRSRAQVPSVAGGAEDRRLSGDRSHRRLGQAAALNLPGQKRSTGLRVDERRARPRDGRPGPGGVNDMETHVKMTVRLIQQHLSTLASRRAPRRAGRLARGVTLVEVLIVITIMALISGGAVLVAFPMYKESQVKSAKVSLDAV